MCRETEGWPNRIKNYAWLRIESWHRAAPRTFFHFAFSTIFDRFITSWSTELTLFINILFYYHFFISGKKIYFIWKSLSYRRKLSKNQIRTVFVEQKLKIKLSCLYRGESCSTVPNWNSRTIWHLYWTWPYWTLLNSSII